MARRRRKFVFESVDGIENIMSPEAYEELKEKAGNAGFFMHEIKKMFKSDQVSGEHMITMGEYLPYLMWEYVVAAIDYHAENGRSREEVRGIFLNAADHYRNEGRSEIAKAIANKLADILEEVANEYL
ncbi:MAG: hypothetical protein D6698_15545 [Gammaproteobacteria bacterium]|nr:MAG: hypothetical protein D6698_15545 [Gammaproteobacteria bacterium]